MKLIHFVPRNQSVEQKTCSIQRDSVVAPAPALHNIELCNLEGRVRDIIDELSRHYLKEVKKTTKHHLVYTVSRLELEPTNSRT
jgi:hypothetical protein